MTENKLDNNNEYFKDSHNTLTFFSMMIAFVLSIMYYLARINLDNPIISVINTLGVSFFLLLSQQIYRLYIKPKWGKLEKDLILESIIPLISLSLLIIAGFLSSIININIAFIFSFSGFIFSLIIFKNFLVSNRRKTIIVFISLSVIFSLWLGGNIWGIGYLHPRFYENLLQGNANMDTLFHTAISNLIKTYGIPNTGLDGIIYLPYHTGSHWIFAHLSTLLNLNSLSFYQLGYPVIFLPFLYFNFFTFALIFKEYNPLSLKFPNLKLSENYVFWLIFFLCIIQFIPTELGADLSVGISYFGSESHGTGLSFVFISFSLVIAFINHYQINKQLLSQNSYQFKPQEYIFIWLAIVFFISLITITKISLGTLVCGAFVYLNFRLRKSIKKIYVINIVLTIVTFLIMYKLTNFSQTSQFYLFAFQQEQIGCAKVFWLHYYFFWGLLYIILKFDWLKVKTVGEVITEFNHLKILDLEIVLLLSVIGIIPGLLLDIHGGSAAYFMDLQRWLALTLILAQIDNFKQTFKKLIF